MRDDSDSVFDELANLKELGGENPSINYWSMTNLNILKK